MQSPKSSAPPSTVRHWRRFINLLGWRLPAIETYPKVVALAQTWSGQLALFTVFGLLMKFIAPGMWIAERHMWLWITIAAAMVSLAGRYRPLALAVATGVLLARAPGWFDFSAVETVVRQELVFTIIHPWDLRAATLLGCVPLAFIAIQLAHRFRDHPLGRRPILLLHMLYFCLIGVAVSHQLRGLSQAVLWSLLAVFSTYFWYLAYALMDQRHPKPAPVLLHFGTFSAFYSSTVVPVGKGAQYWRSVEATTPQELAVTQLKALKLLTWALILKGVVLALWTWSFYGKLNVLPLRFAFEEFLKGGDVRGLTGIASVLVNFPHRLLVVAIGGHVIVASARLAGFRLLRNTYRPLSSRTIAEFWNRYVYYFKEVLVHVYFYPTFVRYFKKHPRLRVAFATFIAAGVGNFLFHFMENYTLATYGLLEALVRAQTYAFYCVVLATGIIVSQLRNRKHDPNAGWVRRQLIPSLVVASFFCFLSFFDGPQRHVSLAEHFQFLFHVFGVDRWIKVI